MDLPLAYRSTRERLLDLVTDLEPADAMTFVPATPEWTVKDTYAHLAGAAADVIEGRLEGAGSDEWTRRQVEDRSGRSLIDIAQEWADLGPAFEERLRADTDGLWRFVAGTWLHEQDIRGALGLRGVRDTEGGRVALGLVDLIADRLTDAGLQGLIIEAGGHRWTLGTPPAAATLRCERYELARVAGGRRSMSQMRALDWDGDAEPYLPHLTSYGPPAADLDD